MGGSQAPFAVFRKKSSGRASRQVCAAQAPKGPNSLLFNATYSRFGISAARGPVPTGPRAKPVREGGRSRPRRGAAKRRGGTRPHGQAISKSSADLCREKMAVQERHEGLARRPPVEALHRPVVEHVVDPAHLLVQDGVERTSLRQHPAHDPVAVLARPALPRMVRLREVDLETERLLEATKGLTPVVGLQWWGSPRTCCDGPPVS